MRKKLLIIGFMVLIIIVLGGWFFMKMAERPTALKDSLTASHLDKESRTSEGFFRYTSKKNEYSMLFPEEFAIDRESFEEKEKFESWHVYPSDDQEESLLRSIKYMYSYDRSPDAFFKQYSYKGEYETIKAHESTQVAIHIGAVYNSFDKDAKMTKLDPAKYGPSLVLAMVENKDTGENIRIISSVRCPKNTTCEKVSLEDEQNFVLKMAKSIKFNID
ncbi:hypothetical protein FZC83_17940 [Rossellomorea marisflavi]|uniref:Uncharacterized protein n=1 Tax=Rossellomorea marisflavi TaxID=189381 RepID=A0A5D4RPP2_9BACI|nr:hypothetical protein [Rossellomorea marisflavi]TYS51452.1 hypothetical protein FZC83_17940 [Rossellomorea marisflavi]